MKKRVLAILMSGTMAAGMLTGCGGGSTGSSADSAPAADSGDTADSGDAAAKDAGEHQCPDV